MAQNVINGVICSTAKVEKETEKALCMTYSVDIYGEWFVDALIRYVKKFNISGY